MIGPFEEYAQLGIRERGHVPRDRAPDQNVIDREVLAELRFKDLELQPDQPRQTPYFFLRTFFGHEKQAVPR